MPGAKPHLLGFASNLSANPGSSMPKLCVLGKLPSLSAPRFAPPPNGGVGRDLLELLGAGLADPTGKVRTQSAQDEC